MKYNLAAYPNFVEACAGPKITATLESRLACGGLGLAGESGEVADLIKKVLFHDIELTKEIRERIVEELGDVGWYKQLIQTALGITDEEVKDYNITKLLARYPERASKELTALNSEQD